MVTGLLYLVNDIDNAPTSVLEKISNKLRGIFLLPLELFGIMPNTDSLKLKLELAKEVGGLLLVLIFFFS